MEFDDVQKACESKKACSRVIRPIKILTYNILQVCLVPLTSAYALDGYFTGIKSKVVVPQSSLVVYESLAKNLHHIFQTIEVISLLEKLPPVGCDLYG